MAKSRPRVVGASAKTPRTSASRAWLERALSKKGLASRTEARALILAGRVAINGAVSRNPRAWVHLTQDSLTLDAQVIATSTQRIVVLFHKPRGVVTTRRDEKSRKTIYDVVPPEYQALIAVGRLDQATSGLLILTNDRGWASELLDPKNKIPRVYLVEVSGAWTERQSQQCITGVLVSTPDGPLSLRADSIEIKKTSGRESQLIITLTQGKNREIRRLIESQGSDVLRLKRLSFGDYQLGNLAPGQCQVIES